MKGIFRMKPKVYYYFKESIKNRKDYLRRMRDYFFYREMYVTSKNMLFKRKPITSLLLWLINLPINTWRYIIFLQDKYDCERAQVDIDIMQNFIEEIDKKEMISENKNWRKLYNPLSSKNKNNSEHDKYH